MPADAIAAARAFLPVWAVWSPLASIAAGAVLCAIFSAAAIAYASRPLRCLAPNAHWTDRARLVWPVRRGILLAWVSALVASAPLAVGGPFSRPGALGRWILGPAVSLVAALAVAFAFENRFVRRLPLGARWRGAAGYALLLLPAYWGAGVFAIWAAQTRLSLAWSLAIGCIVVALAVGAAPWLGRAVRLTKPATPRLQAALSRVLRDIGGPPARLLVFPMPSANAFAFQLTRTIGVTEGALASLDDGDLDALLAHELGHLREPPGVVLLRTMVIVLLPVSLVILPWVLQLRSELGWLALWLFAIAVLVAYQRLQRALERRADAVGRTASRSYAAALEKVYRVNLTPAVLRRAATHPDLFDRMVAAGGTPAWPRPAPPPSLLPHFMMLVALAGATFAGAWYARSAVEESWRDDEPGLTLRVAMDGRPYDTGRLAYWHLHHNDENAALALFRAAEVMDNTNATWPAWVATVLSYQGRCAEAAVASERASSLDAASPHARAARDVITACAAQSR